MAADPVSKRLLDQVRSLASGLSTVLLRGESGVGKKHLAQILHCLGPYADEPFMCLPCGGAPAESLETELFGYEPGAFPGGTQTRRGRLELARAGTLVLEEVAAFSMATQAKFLRAIEQRSFLRLGSTRAIPIEARLVALTSVDLERAVTRRTFREDLYFRLNVVSVLVAPLRERRGDVLPLADYFLRHFAEVHRKPYLTFEAGALAALQAYSYPGNVRELRQIVERAVLNGTAPEILPQDLPACVREALPSLFRKMSLEELERKYIAEVLDFTRGKKTQAARILGISRKTLLEKRKRYGIA
ncbi:MAG: sigma 54-interacting transcriptional regulator [Terriglobales bacterium]